MIIARRLRQKRLSHFIARTIGRAECRVAHRPEDGCRMRNPHGASPHPEGRHGGARERAAAEDLRRPSSRMADVVEMRDWMAEALATCPADAPNYGALHGQKGHWGTKRQIMSRLSILSTHLSILRMLGMRPRIAEAPSEFPSLSCHRRPMRPASWASGSESSRGFGRMRRRATASVIGLPFSARGCNFCMSVERKRRGSDGAS